MNAVNLTEQTFEHLRSTCIKVVATQLRADSTIQDFVQKGHFDNEVIELGLKLLNEYLEANSPVKEDLKTLECTNSLIDFDTTAARICGNYHNCTK